MSAIRAAREHVADHWAEWTAAARKRDENVEKAKWKNLRYHQRLVNHFVDLMYARLDAYIDLRPHWMPNTTTGVAVTRVYEEYWPAMRLDALEVKYWATPYTPIPGLPSIGSLKEQLEARLRDDGITVNGPWEWGKPFDLVVRGPPPVVDDHAPPSSPDDAPPVPQ